MKLIAINILSNVFVRLIPLFVSFAVLPFIIHHIGKEVFGVWAFLDAYLVVILSFDLGFGITNEREVARLNSKNNYDDLRNFIFSISIFQLLIGSILAVTFVIIINYSLGIYNFLEESQSQIKDMYILFFFYILTVYFINNIRGILRGLQKHYVILFVNFIYVFFRVSVLLLLLPTLNDLFGFAILNYFSFLVELIVLFIVITFILKINYLKLKMVKIPLVFLRLSMDVFFLQLLSIMLFASGKIILGFFVTATAIAYYEIGNRIFNVIRNFIDSIARVLLPVVSEINLLGDDAKLKMILTKGTSNLFYLWSFIAFPLLVAIDKFIILWLGSDFLKSVPVIYFFILSTGFITLTRVSLHIFIASANLKKYLAIRFTLIFLYLFLNYILSSRYGIIGPALAMLLYSILSESYLIYYSIKQYNLSFMNFLSLGIVKVFIFNIILFLFFQMVLCPQFVLNSYFKISIIVTLYMMCSLLFLCSFIIKKDEREFLLKKLFSS